MTFWIFIISDWISDRILNRITDQIKDRISDQILDRISNLILDWISARILLVMLVSISDSCASHSDSLISLSYSLPGFSVNSFGLFILFIQTALQSVSSDFCFSQCFELP